VPNPTPDAGRPTDSHEDPWAELARRPHIKFAEHELPEATGGGAFARWKNGDVIILLDPRLSETEKGKGLTKFLEDDTRPRQSS
jgi:hypothetical protein